MDYTTDLSNSHSEIHSEAYTLQNHSNCAGYYVAMTSASLQKNGTNNTFPTTTESLHQVWDLVSEKFKAEIISQQITPEGHFTLTLKNALQIWKPSSKRQDDNPTNWIFVHAGNEKNQIRGIIEKNKIRFKEGFKVKFGILPALATEVTLESTGENTIKATAFKISKSYKVEKIKDKVSLCKCSDLK